MTSSKVAVVTGSNKGIGFAIVKKLCQQFDGVVYLTSRNEERGKAAVAELEKVRSTLNKLSKTFVDLHLK